MYVATINVPGYLPMDDDPPTFDTPQEAWAYLAEELKRGEDDIESDSDGYSQTWETLAALGTDAHWQRADPAQDRAWLADHGLAPDGTGSITGDTPGYAGSHDLGLAYSVSVAE